ncbi:MAG: hypothetical protein Q7T18_11185, partial [Sedimentisphaerales bacterium]|nr:hypothetical protein [Sedimentisphaerales bacterium]
MRQNHLPRRPASGSAKKHMPDTATVTAASLADEHNRQKYFDSAVLVILLILGIYNSALYFGYKVMPTSDFPAFFGVGKAVLSGHLPADFKRGPVLGIFQVLLSWVVGGQSPDLTAGWLLNALLYPASVVLLWLVGRKLVGNSAIWLAIIVAINPQTILMLTDPIAETTLMFFILLTLYLIFIRSRWSYTAAAAASMIRYECAALIFAAFIVDVIYHKTARERVKACVFLILGSMPLAFWMLETLLHWQSQDATHYLKVFSPEYGKLFTNQSLQNKIGLFRHLNLLWYVGFNPVLMPDPTTGQDVFQAVETFSKVFIMAGFLFGAVYGCLKKNWNIVVLLIFFVPYVVTHSRYPYLVPRYYQTVFWIAMFVCWYGYRELWRLIDKNGRVPRLIVIAVQALLLLVAMLWLNLLLPFMGELKTISPGSSSIPYVVGAAMAAIALAYGVIYKARRLFTVITVSAVMVLIVISNQFMLASVVRDGQVQAEFKQLAQWYLANI